MKLANKIWLGILVCLVLIGFSGIHEFYQIKQNCAEYLAHWDDEIAQGFLQKRDPQLLQKILSQLEKENVVVEDALGLIQAKIKSASRLSFKYPVSYLGLPVGHITFGVPISLPVRSYVHA